MPCVIRRGPSVLSEFLINPVAPIEAPPDLSKDQAACSRAPRAITVHTCSLSQMQALWVNSGTADNSNRGLERSPPCPHISPHSGRSRRPSQNGDP
jgi:hypothetical protein